MHPTLHPLCKIGSFYYIELEISLHLSVYLSTLVSKRGEVRVTNSDNCCEKKLAIA